MYSSGTLTGRFAARLPARVLGEQRLARMAARGEQGAFEALFERYHRELYRYCRAVLGESEEAHDALQNTMAAALRHLPQLERRSSLRGWLYRVAHNEAVSILRRRAEPVEPDGLAEATVAGADVEFEQRERLRQLVADLQALPERQRGALVMRELSDLTYSQIAAATATSEAGARQLVYEARESLRSLELGRHLECEAARRVISERDGRMLRGRRLRAHLGSCDSCRDFQTAIATRRADLGVLFPPLVPAATSGLLASLLGEAGHGAASATATGATAVAGGGGAALGAAGLKAASIVSVVAIGTGTVGVSQKLDLSFGGGDDGTDAAVVAPGPGPAAAVRADTGAKRAGWPARLAGGGPRSRAAAAHERHGNRARASGVRAAPAAGNRAPAKRASTTPPGHSQAATPGHSEAGPPPHAGGQSPAGRPSPPGGGAAGQPAGARAPAGDGSGVAIRNPSTGGDSGPSASVPKLPSDNAVPSASTRGAPHNTKLEGGTR